MSRQKQRIISLSPLQNYVTLLMICMDILTLRSSIPPLLIRNTLWRGSAIAGSAATALLLAAITAPPLLLNRWGWILAILAFLTIAWGLRPYRTLSELERHPNKILLCDDNTLQFYWRGSALFTIDIKIISKLSYIADSTEYGIAIELIAPLPPHSISMSRSASMRQLLGKKRGQNKEKVDLFLPYFSSYSFNLLRSELNQLEN